MRDKLQYIFYFILFVLIQVFILNNVQIGGLINPYLYIMFILILPTSISSYILMLIGFGLGMTIDLFSNTLGIHTAATVLICYLRPRILSLFCSQEDLEKPVPNFKNIGRHFIPYVLSMVFIANLTLFSLEAFSMSFFWVVLAKTAINTLITSLLIISIQSFTIKN